MNESRAKARRFRPGTLIATLALFIVLGGTATAASGLINGKKIKPGTVTSKQIRNKTITAAKLNPSAVSALRVTGATGAAGTTGATGAAGSAGVVKPISAEAFNRPLPNGTQIDLLNFSSPPAGTYVLTAKATLTSNTASNDMNCSIWVDGTSAVDEVTVDPIGFNQTLPVSLMAVTEVQGPITLKCTSMDGVGSADDIKLIAVPVQN